MLNDDGKCYSFDHRGSGYGRGEGAAALVLKRLDHALTSCDPIRAVIRGTGINQDGKTAGITLPNQKAQQKLILSTYRTAGLDPLNTIYVEAHGTGTAAGDLSEVKALESVFAMDGRREFPLYLGSTKANIGHLESASGIAGLIKAVLMLEKGIIPGNPNLEELKDDLDIDSKHLIVSMSSP